jgi:hypothetical protein
MALIVEDGTGSDPTANSYVSFAEISAFCTLRGVTVPAEAATNVLAIKAMDYLETKWYVGELIDVNQPLSWPRKCVCYENGTPFPEDAIPKNLKNAEMQLVLEQVNGVDIMPTDQGGAFITREKVDVIEVDYSEKLGTFSPSMPLVDAYLQGLLRSSGLRAVRV